MCKCYITFTFLFVYKSLLSYKLLLLPPVYSQRQRRAQWFMGHRGVVTTYLEPRYCHIYSVNSAWEYLCPSKSFTILRRNYILQYLSTFTFPVQHQSPSAGRDVISQCLRYELGYVMTRLLDALRCKPGGHGFGSRSGYRDFHWLNISGRTIALG